MISFPNIDFYSFGCASLAWEVFFSCMGMRTLSCGRQESNSLTRDQTSGIGSSELSHYPTREVPQWYNFLTCSHLHMEKPSSERPIISTWSCLAWEAELSSLFQSLRPNWTGSRCPFSFAVLRLMFLINVTKDVSHLQSMPSGSLDSGNSIDSLKSGVERGQPKAFLSP